MLDVPSNKNLPQPEIDGSYKRGFTILDGTEKDICVVIGNGLLFCSDQRGCEITP